MKLKIKIGDRLIGKNEPVFIIAEAGVNHNGNLELAKKLIDVAKDAGADAVKFQTFKAENLNTKTAPKATYHIETTSKKGSWFELLKTQELNLKMHKVLIKHAKKRHITFLSTPYDKESADLLDGLNIPAFKIASTDANNIPFLRYLARKKRPIILSTGMCTMEEVLASVKAIRAERCQDLILLHCTANYPAEPEDTNLKAIVTLKNRFNVPVGYSDHTMGIVNPVAATALGSMVYEKHFTLDKDLPGPDHRSSLNPQELKELVQHIRDTERVLGSGIKLPAKSEEENRSKLRKSVVAKVDILKGTVIEHGMLALKRPGTGITPREINRLLGKKTKLFLKQDTVIKPEHLGGIYGP